MAEDGPDGKQPPIADYGFLSDCHSAALVDRSGSVDWWCLPRFDSSSVLGRLLDPAAGHWSLRPVDDFSSERGYVGDTLVLRTVLSSASGTVSVTEALLLEPGARGHEIGLRSPHVLLRRVVGEQGTVRMSTDLSVRMEYGRTEPHLRHLPGGVEAKGGPVTLTLSTEVPLDLDGGSVLGEFDVTTGDVIDLRLSYAPSFGPGSHTTMSRPSRTPWTVGPRGLPSTPDTTATMPIRSAAARSCCRASPTDRRGRSSQRLRRPSPRRWAER
jgi:hypothetical protein